MRFVIVTGMSGAGKSTAMKILEDLGYYCVDNLPIMLINKFMDMASGMDKENVSQFALGVDARSGEALLELDNILDNIKNSGKTCEILFLEASEATLIKRYKESRRMHPLGVDGRMDEGIRRERELLAFLRKKADFIIDTDVMLVKELRAELEKIFVDNKEFKNIFINVTSFGFKFGVPTDADLIFDVRFLPNPYYVEALREHTGNEKEVNDYVMNSEVAIEFFERLKDMITFLIPNYIAEGRNQLVISIGCTGGKHRSVTIANMLYRELKKIEGYGVKITHRDVDKK
jgi:UPF0042 nucleotide-binding protein